jgi:hypothetical protein
VLLDDSLADRGLIGRLLRTPYANNFVRPRTNEFIPGIDTVACINAIFLDMIDTYHSIHGVFVIVGEINIVLICSDRYLP